MLFRSGQEDPLEKGTATQSNLPGEPQGQRSLVGCCLWGRTESDTTEVPRVPLRGEGHFMNYNTVYSPAQIQRFSSYYVAGLMVQPSRGTTNCPCFPCLFSNVSCICEVGAVPPRPAREAQPVVQRGGRCSPILQFFILLLSH